MKTLVFHDTFLKRSGSERMTLDMASILGADIATAIWSTHTYDASEMGYHGQIYEVFPRYHGGWVGWIRMKWRFFWSWKIMKKYDTIIFSDEASSAVHLTPRNIHKIYYAHTLPHELFDGRKEFMKKALFFYHEFYIIALFFRKYLFLYEMRKMHIIATNSIENKKWLSLWTGREDIQVIYPPVNMLRFRPVRQKLPFIIQEHNNVETVIEKEIYDYYISFARLTESKRIDRIIHAFQHMPEKNLIILYNPNDPDKEKLMKMAVGCNNIFFHYESRDMKMANIISSAVASITLGQDENYGTVAVESMSCGIPVISVDEGGFRETIIQGRTGLLMPKDFSIYDTMEAVKWMTPEQAQTMSQACISRAGEFSMERFGEELKKYFITPL